jgi:hypothetical protein
VHETQLDKELEKAWNESRSRLKTRIFVFLTIIDCIEFSTTILVVMPIYIRLASWPIDLAEDAAVEVQIKVELQVIGSAQLQASVVLCCSIVSISVVYSVLIVPCTKMGLAKGYIVYSKQQQSICFNQRCS